MPQKCYVKPNRSKPRLWNPPAVARVWCDAIQNGHTEAELREAVTLRCGDPEGRRRGELQEAVAEAIAQLSANNELLNADAQLLQRFLTLTAALGLAARIIARLPIAPARAAGLALLGLRELASSRLQRITVQRAANEATIARLRAANDEVFRRVSGL